MDGYIAEQIKVLVSEPDLKKIEKKIADISAGGDKNSWIGIYLLCRHVRKNEMFKDAGYDNFTLWIEDIATQIGLKSAAMWLKLSAGDYYYDLKYYLDLYISQGNDSISPLPPIEELDNVSPYMINHVRGIAMLSVKVASLYMSKLVNHDIKTVQLIGISKSMKKKRKELGLLTSINKTTTDDDPEPRFRFIFDDGDEMLSLMSDEEVSSLPPVPDYYDNDYEDASYSSEQEYNFYDDGYSYEDNDIYVDDNDENITSDASSSYEGAYYAPVTIGKSTFSPSEDYSVAQVTSLIMRDSSWIGLIEDRFEQKYDVRVEYTALIDENTGDTHTFNALILETIKAPVYKANIHGIMVYVTKKSIDSIDFKYLDHIRCVVDKLWLIVPEGLIDVMKKKIYDSKKAISNSNGDYSVDVGLLSCSFRVMDNPVKVIEQARYNKNTRKDFMLSQLLIKPSGI